MKNLSVAILLTCAASTPAGTSSLEFNCANAEAMERMMSAMHRPSTGDVDRDYVSTMTPHQEIEAMSIAINTGPAK